MISVAAGKTTSAKIVASTLFSLNIMLESLITNLYTKLVLILEVWYKVLKHYLLWKFFCKVSVTTRSQDWSLFFEKSLQVQTISEIVQANLSYPNSALMGMLFDARGLGHQRKILHRPFFRCQKRFLRSDPLYLSLESGRTIN